jgi:uncharacterized protein YodC (DUF2158 family)
MNSFKKGDTVRLKSGGPLMTVVAEVDDYGSYGSGVKCQWFDGKRREEAIFDPESIVKSDDNLRSVPVLRG